MDADDNQPSHPNEEQEAQMKKTIFLVGLCMAFLLVSVIQVSSAPRSGVSLSGTYYLQGTSTCVQTPLVAGNVSPYTGFDNTLVLLNSATMRIRHTEGTLVLNRDGTGTADMNTMQIYPSRLSSGEKPLNVWSGQCLVSYAAQPDGTNTMTFNDCDGEYPGAFGLPVPSGVLSYTLKMVVVGSGDLYLSQTEPSYPPEVAWEGSTSDGTYKEGERECARTLNAVRIGN